MAKPAFTTPTPSHVWHRCRLLFTTTVRVTEFSTLLLPPSIAMSLTTQRLPMRASTLVVVGRQKHNLIMSATVDVGRRLHARGSALPRTVRCPRHSWLCVGSTKTQCCHCRHSERWGRLVRGSGFQRQRSSVQYSRTPSSHV